MEKLISMTDFVLEDNGIHQVVSYAKFLSKNLNISMLVPAKLVDGERIVLEEPKDYEDVILQGSRVYHYDDILACREYETALSNVLFEGFELITNEKNQRYFTYQGQSVFIDKCWALRHETIEDIVELQPTLTTTAKKQIGL